MSLRPYQQKAIDEIKAIYMSGLRKALLHMPTGGGKTHIFSHVVKESAKKGKKSLIVVRGRELVEQASQRLFREKVEHGVRMAGHWNRNYGAPTQVCSIDTLISRKQFPHADIIVIDEVDQATSAGYHKLAERYSDSFFLGVTATPYTKKPLRHIADEIVKPVTVDELIKLGFLAPPRYYAPSEPDLSGVKIVNSEYHNSQLEERMGSLTGDIVEHWKRLGEGRPTVCFAVSVAHSKILTETFLDAGIPAEHCDANTTDIERKKLMDRLASGETKVVCNVGILCRGVDMPFLGCLIMARPTRSYNLYIQQAGRGTRTFPGKKDFILLDHAGNVTRHGYITVEPPADLDGMPKGPLAGTGLNIKTCKVCYLIYETTHCPDCGPQEKNERANVIYTDPGSLKELQVSEKDPVEQFIEHAKRMAKQRKYKQAWVWHQVAKRFGKDVVQEYAPKWFLSFHSDNVFLGSPYRALGT